jgi:F420-non-reducing hydrogenase iron-sulfur subunit
VNYLHGLLDQVGLKGERVKMANLSAAMGARFAEIATEMVEKIRELGPNPLREDHEPGGKL